MKYTSSLFILVLFNAHVMSQGLIFNPEAFNKGQKLEKTRANYVPSKSSLEDFTPYAMTQNRGNCVAYSFATARTMLLAKNLKLSGKDTITTFLFSPHWVYFRNKESDDDDCMKGLDIEKVASDVLTSGIPLMIEVEYSKYYPFSPIELCNYYPPSFNDDLALAKKFRVDNIYRASDLELIKIAISSGMPTVVGMLLPPSFKEVKSSGIWYPKYNDSYENAVGHSLVIVGYDDNKYGGAVHILNSWGEKWGDKGFAWIKYKDFIKYSLGAYALDNKIKFRDNISLKLEDQNLIKDKNIKTPIDTMVIDRFNDLKILINELHQ